MKYISLVIMIVLMAWTWSAANSTRHYGLQESGAMETEIETVIVDYIRTQRPTLKSVNFRQLFTEVVRPDEEIRAHMKYSIVDSAANGDLVEQQFQGTLLLVKSKQDQTWRSAAINIQSPLVEFKEGAQISAGPDEATPATAPVQPETPAKE
ncbi:MAG: hypothetical protein NDI61_01395 [Bdellovibrionaceae bacterium]|nr:hypothetical protein [Pseudobdellovibrionaceae bacterium]